MVELDVLARQVDEDLRVFLRTNPHFTLKTRRLTRTDPEGRWRPYAYEEIVARDKASLDLFWLRDESLEDSAGLPEPHRLAQEIANDLRSALAQIEDVLGDLEQRAGAGPREGPSGADADAEPGEGRGG